MTTCPTAKRLVKTFEKVGVISSAKKLAGPYAHDALQEARKFHLPKLLVAAVIYQETRGLPENTGVIVSGSGAVGPMQLMPNTAWNFLHVNPWKPAENIEGGAKYLKHLVDEFHSVKTALIAYNAGPSAVSAGQYPYASIYYAHKIMENAGIIPV